MLATALTVVAIFGLHVYLRLYSTLGRPTTEWPAYAHSYSTSLSLMLGRGYHRLPLAPNAESQPIKDFLDQKRDAITPDDLAAYQATIANQTVFDIGKYAYIDDARVFDICSAAAIWRVTGPSWSALSYSYAVLSALAGLAIFFGARTLTRSNFCGLLGMLLFAIAPQEKVVWFARDLNPMWFGAFAFAWLFCLTYRYNKHWLNLASCFGLGVVSMIGYGWRPDNLIYVPFMLLAAVLVIRAKGASWKLTSAGAVCCLAGSAAVWLVIDSATDAPKNSMGNRLHVAYFGEQSRSDILGLENSLQIFRDDSKVASDAFVLHDALQAAASQHLTGNTAASKLVYCGENYGDICAKLYVQTLRHNVFYWVAGIPKVLLHAAQGANSGTRDYYFALFVCGLLALFLRNANRLALGILLAFFVYYTAIWFSVSPEQRHWGPLLVPICLVASFAPFVVVFALRGAFPRNWRVWSECLHFRPIALVAGGLVGLWLVACGISYVVSSNERAAYLAEIDSRAKAATSAASAIKSPKMFSVSTADESQPHREGYLLTIRTGEAPAELRCSHLRLAKRQILKEWNWPGTSSLDSVWDEMRKIIWWNSYAQTRHRLQPNSQEQFFVTFARSSYGGDTRQYTLEVELLGEGEIVDAVRLDLSDWQRLQVSTVISEGSDNTLTPRVGGEGTLVRLQFPSDPEFMAKIGIPEHLAPQRR